MIRLLAQKDEEGLKEKTRHNPFGCRLLSAIQAYGWDRPFLRVWSDDSAVYALQDSSLTICGRPADGQEAAAFARMVGASTVTGRTEDLAGWTPFSRQSGVILYHPVAPSSGNDSDEKPPVQSLYRVLQAAGLLVPDFEAFYLDLNHRLRHGAADAVLWGEKACAVLGALTREEAVLTAVAVVTGARRQGLGNRCVTTLMAQHPEVSFWALRGSGENRDFYRKLGFTEVGRWKTVPVEPADS